VRLAGFGVVALADDLGCVKREKGREMRDDGWKTGG